MLLLFLVVTAVSVPEASVNPPLLEHPRIHDLDLRAGKGAEKWVRVRGLKTDINIFSDADG